jgi:hypothetical protein
MKSAKTYSNCDCHIGRLCDEYIYISNMNKQIDDIIKTQQNLKQFNLLNGEVITSKEILDSRKGYLHKFNYCPYCGEKIDWKILLFNIKENETKRI